MSTTLDELIKQLKQAIAELEVQSLILGDIAVDAACGDQPPLRSHRS